MNAIPPPAEVLPDGMPESIGGYDSYDLWYGYMGNQFDHIEAALLDEFDLAIRPGRQFDGLIISYGISKEKFALRFKQTPRLNSDEFFAIRYSLERNLYDIILETFDTDEVIGDLTANGYGPDESWNARVIDFPDRTSEIALKAVVVERASADSCPRILKNLKAIENYSLPKINTLGVGREKKLVGRFQDPPWYTVHVPIMTGDSNDTILYVLRGDQKSEAARIVRRLTKGLDDCSWETVTLD